LLIFTGRRKRSLVVLQEKHNRQLVGVPVVTKKKRIMKKM